MKSFTYVVGIDEAGRGPIAGPVSVGVFVTRKNFVIKNGQRLRKIFPGLNDSKKLSGTQRERIFSLIENAVKKGDVTFCVILVSAKIIDQKGITKAVQIGIDKAIKGINLFVPPALGRHEKLRSARLSHRLSLGGIKKLDLNYKNTFIYLDGLLRAPKEFSQKTVIKGDVKIAVISAASICAKVVRDRHMKKMAEKYLDYGFEKHKGYGTKEHYKAVSKYGLSFEHRKTYLKNYQQS